MLVSMDITKKESEMPTKTPAEKAKLIRDELKDIRVESNRTRDYPFAFGRACALLLLAATMIESTDPVSAVKALDDEVAAFQSLDRLLRSKHQEVSLMQAKPTTHGPYELVPSTVGDGFVIRRQDADERKRTVSFVSQINEWHRFVLALEDGHDEVAAVAAIDANWKELDTPS